MEGASHLRQMERMAGGLAGEEAVCCHVCYQPQAQAEAAPCGYCRHLICASCVVQCEGCKLAFCSFCSTPK